MILGGNMTKFVGGGFLEKKGVKFSLDSGAAQGSVANVPDARAKLSK